MKQVSLFLLLGVFLPWAHAANITCASCDLGNTTCISKICVEEDCATLTESTTSGTKDSPARTYKGCLKPEACKPRAFTFTTAVGKTVRSSLTCCVSEKCNENLTAAVPPSGSFENGAHCPVCESSSQHPCESKASIACTGAEQKCITLEGTSIADKSQNFSIRGCASENACDLGANELVPIGGKVYQLTKKAVCTNAGTLAAPAAPLALLTAALGFLLTRHS